MLAANERTFHPHAKYALTSPLAMISLAPFQSKSKVQPNLASGSIFENELSSDPAYLTCEQLILPGR
jgi:hypothetical protein